MMESMIAESMGRLGTETAFEVLARAKALERQGKSVVHLEIGRARLRHARAHPRRRGAGARRTGATHYGPSAGLPELREAIAEHIEKTRGVPVSPDEVVVTPGAKPIMFFVIMALTDPGDEVVYPNPGFPIYESVINFVGRAARADPAPRGNRLRLRPRGARARVSKKTKLIIINSPENPTGGVLSPEDVGRIADLARHYGVLVLSDEIYRRLLYDGSSPRSRPAGHEAPRPSSWTASEVLRDDRLASRLRSDAEAPRRAPHPAHDQLRLVHRDLHPARGLAAIRGPRTPCRNGRGVPAPARSDRRRAEPHPGRDVQRRRGARSTCSRT